MEDIAELQHERDGAMEVSEIDDGELLLELLNASVAVEMEAAAGWHALKLQLLILHRISQLFVGIVKITVG
jgi:hypothetical protein